MDLSPGSRRPVEDLQGVGIILAVAAMGHVPALSPSRFLQEGKGVHTSRKAGSPTSWVKKGAALCKISSVGRLELLKFAHIRRGGNVVVISLPSSQKLL